MLQRQNLPQKGIQEHLPMENHLPRQSPPPKRIHHLLLRNHLLVIQTHLPM